jgi:cardiolipin synthase
MDKELMDVDWSQHSTEAFGIASVGKNIIGTSTLRGSRYTLLSDTQQILNRIAVDIENAQTSVLMEFYIWHAGGTADVVLDMDLLEQKETKAAA